MAQPISELPPDPEEQLDSATPPLVRLLDDIAIRRQVYELTNEEIDNEDFSIREVHIVLDNLIKVLTTKE